MVYDRGHVDGVESIRGALGSLHGPMGIHSAMSWGNHCSTHGDKRQTHWRVGGQ